MNNPFNPKMKELSQNIENIKKPIKAFRSLEIGAVEHRSTRNEYLEGQTYPGTDVEYRRRRVNIDGQKIEGVFPKFDSKFDVRLPKELHKADSATQFRYCTKELAKSPTLRFKGFTSEQLEQIKNGDKIRGYTWHHNESQGLMQLVRSDIHSKCGHTGGASLWGR